MRTRTRRSTSSRLADGYPPRITARVRVTKHGGQFALMRLLDPVQVE